MKWFVAAALWGFFIMAHNPDTGEVFKFTYNTSAGCSSGKTAVINWYGSSNVSNCISD